MNKHLYILSLTLVFIIPTILAGFVVLPHVSLLHLAVFVIKITIVAVLWDVWATRHGRKDPIWLWTFNRKATLGLYIFGLPIEEFLFYIFSSVYVIFLWEVIRLAIEMNNLYYYFAFPALALWTGVSIYVPFMLTSKHDMILE